MWKSAIDVEENPPAKMRHKSEITALHMPYWQRAGGLKYAAK
jgi:hypothetical protein